MKYRINLQKTLICLYDGNCQLSNNECPYYYPEKYKNAKCPLKSPYITVELSEPMDKDIIDHYVCVAHDYDYDSKAFKNVNGERWWEDDDVIKKLD